MTDPINPIQRNQAVVAAVERADGSIVPTQADDDGRVIVTAEGGSAGDAPELPAPTTPGDTDPNAPTTFIASRMQGWDGSAWARVLLFTDELADGERGVAVRFRGEQAVRETAASTRSLDTKTVVGTPGVDKTNVAVPFTAARLQSYNAGSGRWEPVPAYDPLAQDPPANPGALWSRLIDFPDAVRVQIIDAATGNSSLFFSGVPAPNVSGFAVRIVPSGETSTRNSQAVVLAREHLTGHAELRTVNPRYIYGFTAGAVEDTEQLGFSGTGTHQAHVATLSQEIAVSGASGQAQSFETHTAFPVPANTPLVIRAVAAMSDAGQANQVRLLRFGTATDYAGMWLNGTAPEIVVVTALYGTTTTIPRTQWFDPMDGTGPSGAVIDWTKFNTFELMVAGPGANLGAATINGVPIAYVPAHLAAALTLLGSSLPVGCSITNTGASVAGHIRVRAISCNVLGDRAIPTQVVPAPLSPASKTVGVTLAPVLSIRAAALVNGLPNRRFYLPKTVLLTNTGGRVEYQIWRQGALTGPAWTAVGGASGLEFDTTATAFSTVGARQVLAGQLSEARADAVIDLTPYFEEHWTNALRQHAFGGGSDTLTIAAKASVGSAGVIVTLATDEVGA